MKFPVPFSIIDSVSVVTGEGILRDNVFLVGPKIRKIEGPIVWVMLHFLESTGLTNLMSHNMIEQLLKFYSSDELW